ncbi:MAG: GNAT family N-acetyltransferase [Opitutales bacterium]
MLTEAWHRTNQASYPYVLAHQRHRLADARWYFRHEVLATCTVWVALTDPGDLAGLMALQPGWIRQFCVFPAHQRQGFGSALLRHALGLSPPGLRLQTFRRNLGARKFYERHGFQAVAFGQSPPPENEPDVTYQHTG